jgi:hypothetical protein
LAYLATPKDEFEAKNIYDHQDFRGLLHADFEDAIKNTGDSNI